MDPTSVTAMVELLLQHIERYISLTPAEQEVVRASVTPRTIRKRQYLLQAGDVCHQESFVTKGCLRAFYVDPKGHEHILQFAIEEWWIADLNSFLNETPASYHIEALEHSEVLSLDRASVEVLYQEVPAMERYMRILTQKAFVASRQRVIETMSKTAEERYHDFLQRYPRIEQRIPQHQVAAYLGITPEFLSRIRRRTAGS